MGFPPTRRSPGRHELRYVPSVGVEAGFWWGELLTDPRPVDAFSLTYDSVPLKTDLTILGRPHALLRASSSAPLADWFARLSDVAPDGTVTQITGAGINGAQRESTPRPQRLGAEPDLLARYRDAPGHLDLPQRPSHSPGSFKRALADGLADSVCDDDYAATRRR